MATNKKAAPRSFEEMEQLPLHEKLALAEELREAYVASVRNTQQALDPTALRELDVEIANARKRLGMSKKGR